MFKVGNVVSVKGSDVFGIVLGGTGGGSTYPIALVDNKGEGIALAWHTGEGLALVSHHTPRHRDGNTCGQAIYSGDCPRGHYYGNCYYGN